MVSSKLWASQDALLNLITTTLAADPDTDKVAVELGTPTQVKDEHVWISGEVNDWDQSYTVSGLRQKDERYSIRICIAVQRLGLNYAAVRDRAKAIGDLIEDAIHDDYTLGGVVMLSQIKPASLEEALVGDKKRAVGLNIDVEIQATLTT